MGTEGDSFYVVFATAPDAVNAAAQAQRELVEVPWPGGEQVRVRMGIHTGAPDVHDDAYVGMDYFEKWEPQVDTQVLSTCHIICLPDLQLSDASDSPPRDHRT